MKTPEELARFMDAALREHANKVLNGQIQPYHRLLDGATTLNLTLTVVGSSIEVKDADAPPPPPPPTEKELKLEPEIEPYIEAGDIDEIPTFDTPKSSPRRKKKS